jgi:O-antigen biosynthesis protein
MNVPSQNELASHMASFNPIEYPVSLSRPLRLAPSTWIMHSPFAMFLVEALRPALIVELGTQYGVSYCAFCQAVQTLQLDTHCYAVDTWSGDAHAGNYGAEVLNDLKQHHDPRYGAFSHLLQCTFDAALTHFQDASIDLLHIDGYHTYEAVSHDFNTWLPKLSPRGVILFHDISVRDEDFGVWRLWAELKERYPYFVCGHTISGWAGSVPAHLPGVATHPKLFHAIRAQG